MALAEERPIVVVVRAREAVLVLGLAEGSGEWRGSGACLLERELAKAVQALVEVFVEGLASLRRLAPSVAERVVGAWRGSRR